MARNYSQRTIKKLYANSGNQCAMYGCTQQLFPIDLGHNSSEIAHIEGVEPGSARYNSKLTDKELDDYDNLILLCPNHHNEIDAKENTSRYTVDYLKQMKRNHEQDVQNKFLINMAPPKSIKKIKSDIIDALIDKYYNKVRPFQDVSENEIYDAINKILNQSKYTRFVLYNIIINSKMQQDNINMFYLLNSVNISEEEKARQLMVLEKLEFIEEYYFTGDDISNWFENEDCSLTNYSDNYYVKLNKGKWELTKSGKIIRCLYLVLKKDNYTFFDFLVNGEVRTISNIR